MRTEYIIAAFAAACALGATGALGASRAAVASPASIASRAPIASLARATPQAGSRAERVEDLLGRMTLEEKIGLLGGWREYQVKGIARLGIPDLVTSDGPAGCRGGGEATAYPAPICLAATWNTELAFEFGEAIGRDCRARGVHVLLAPAVNICRSPICGRNFEYMGEDPHLTSRMSVSVIRGIQSRGVAATVKHFAANNQEYNRSETSSEVDERTLREIYFPAFKSAVVEGGAACVMSGYNLLNGVHCTQDGPLNNGVLKGEWGFDGVLMSDWGATRDGVRAALGGLDLEMPRGVHMSPESLLAAMDEGTLSESLIDEKVRRIIGTAARMGFLDREELDPAIPLDDPASAAVALEVAREGIVLLKNEGRLLPLDLDELGSLLVVGPNADPTPLGGGGSSYTTPFRRVSVLEGIRARAQGRAEIEHVERDDVYALELVDLDRFEESVFYHRDEEGGVARGLAADYFANASLAGEPVRTGVIERVNFDWRQFAPEGLPRDRFSARFTGFIVPEATGPHALAARADDGIRVYLNDEPVFDEWSRGAPRGWRVIRDLTAGREYAVRIECYDDEGLAEARFGWGPVRVRRDVIDRICAMARGAGAVVLCLGFDRYSEKEGRDRSYRLPGLQEALVARVAEANPRCVVVLNSGGGVRTSTWIDRVPAVLEAWYLGQEAGTALAGILLGEVNPSGKLPITFEARYEDVPSAPYYHATDGKTFYREGVLVGYRGFDKNGVAPLFPFGHGLSYTSFTYMDLRVEPVEGGGPVEGTGTPDATSPGRPLASVSFSVENTGGVAGAEVAQVYVRDVESSVPRPPKELKAFKRLYLNPGESRRVVVTLDARDLSYWDAGEGRWRLESGTFEVLVGASAGDIRLRGDYFCREER
jgi:beta-glucosidase